MGEIHSLVEGKLDNPPQTGLTLTTRSSVGAYLLESPLC